MSYRTLFSLKGLFLIVTTLCSVAHADTSLLSRPPKDNKQIVVNNRILAKVYNKVISVIDVQKKLDVLFFQRFPQYAESPSLRHQFYQVNFMPVLNDLIDKELILADAKDTKLEVSRGDIRQELESLFGPNVFANLAKIGLSYEDAWEMVQGDLLIRRTMMLRVNVKAQNKISPKLVRKKYDEFAEENLVPKRWTYQVISVRHADNEKGAKIAQLLRGELVNRRSSISTLAETYQEMDSVDSETKVSFSEEFQHTEPEISENYKEILSSMQSGMYSQPIAQKSRRNNSTVHRIFHLKEVSPGGRIPFSEVEAQLQSQVTSEAVAAETEKYLNRLRQKANVTQEQIKKNFPENFEPFRLM